MIGNNNRFIFVQAPKTGTSSMQKWFVDNGHVDVEYNNTLRKHISAESWHAVLHPDIFTEAFKFMFVRNPWDRLVSEYHYTKMLAEDPSPVSKHNLHTLAAKKLFEDQAINSFEDFISYIFDNSDSNKTFPVGYLRNAMLHRFACRTGKFSKIGEQIVDYIGRFENLQSDFDEICEKLDIPGSTLPHINSTKRQKDWRSYYTDDTFLKVAEFYIDDIVRFGYEHPDI